MDDSLDMENSSSVDEAEFEASLVSEIDSGLANADTKVIRPPEVPPKREDSLPLRPQPPWAGKLLGHFKLLRLIGQGKMGRVIQAQDINLKRIVALKILNKRLPGIDEQERVNQFLREARAAAQMEHPNIVRIYEINQHDGWWYIAMEMLEGDDLRRMVKVTGPLPPPRASLVIADAATGLAVAHELGIIHRDVKPTNLMLTRHGRCKLTDFGLVRLDDPNDPFDFTDKAVGSPHFMAPEIIRRWEQTPAIDVYSLGATLYFALTGSPPYTGNKLNEILRKHLEAPAPDVRLFSPECPTSLSLLVQRAMAKDPAARPAAADLATALRAEVIVWQPDDTSVLGFGGSGTVTAPVDRTSTTLDRAASAGPAGLMRRMVNSRWFWLLASGAAFLIMVVAVLSSFQYRTGRPWFKRSRDLARLAEYFPRTPENYGILPPNAIPKPIRPSIDDPPPFSWVGKVDTAGLHYVASKKGLHFYPIDAADAVLISSENFVGYKTISDAKADGKVPAP